MRLRLVIKRNELPTVKILHHVPIATTGSITISRLLEDINAIVPLESEIWGLEHYVVQDAEGYECLHFDEVSNVLSDGQEVVIRPLQAKESKARKLAGRDQLSTTGVHLYDGMPFGRNWLKQRADRPNVNIPPPRKRLKMSQDDYDDEGLEEVDHDRASKRMLRIMDRSEEEDDELVFDEDVTENSSNMLRNGKKRKSVSFLEEDDGKELEDDDDDDDSEDDEADYDPEEESSSDGGSDTSSDDDEEEEDKDSVDSNKENSSTVATDQYTELHHRRRQGSSESDSESSEDDDDDDDEDTDFAGLSTPSRNGSQASGQVNEDVAMQDAPKSSNSAAVQAKKPKSAPGEGMRSTQTRNERRAMSKVLQKRKQAGQEEQDLTLAEFRRMIADGRRVKTAKGYYTVSGHQVGTINNGNLFEIRRQALLNSLAGFGVDIDQDKRILDSGHAPSVNQDVQSMNSDVQQVMNADGIADNASLEAHEPILEADNHADGSNQVFAAPEDAGIVQPQLPEPGSVSNEHEGSEEEAPEVLPTVSDVADFNLDGAQRRNKTVDKAASRRLLFGALGVRNPKTKADEDRVRARLDSAGSRKPIVTSKNKASTPASRSIKLTPTSENTDLDSWKSKIRLTAVECVNEDVVLSTPPFPFVQRWDPSQQLGPRGKKRKRKSQGGRNGDEAYEADESQFTYDEPSIQLNYDDEPAEYEGNGVSQPSTITTHFSPKSNSLSKNNAAASYPPLQEVSRTSSILAEEAQDDLEDDLPLLPADLSTLPDLTFADLKKGAIIAFKRLDMSEATSWQPVISAYMTGRIFDRSVDGDCWIRLAMRDRVGSERRKYDEETGERIYGKFEMPDDDDEDDDDGMIEKHLVGCLMLAFPSMIEPKLVQAATDEEKLTSDDVPDGAEALGSGIVVEDSMGIDFTAGSDFQDSSDQQLVQDSMVQPPHTADNAVQDLQAVDTTSQNFIAFDSISSSSSPPSALPVSEPGRIVIEDSQLVDEQMDDDGDDDADEEDEDEDGAESVASTKSIITVKPAKAHKRKRGVAVQGAGRAEHEQGRGG